MVCRACGREERASEGYPCARCGTFICLICTFRGVTLCRDCAAGGVAAGQADDAATADSPHRPVARRCPVYAEPTLRAEQVTQLVLGETAAVLEAPASGAAIRSTSTATSAGCTGLPARDRAPRRPPRWRAEADGLEPRRVAPGRRRLVRAPAPGPGGHRSARRSACPTAGAAALVRGRGRLRARRLPAGGARSAPERWALEHFAGAPYLWGGVTPWGVDCSGLVQTTFAARGVALPRDSRPAGRLRRAGRADAIAAGRPALLPRRDAPSASPTSPSPARRDTLVHSTLACGGMVQEPWLPGPGRRSLRERLVAVRRLEIR